MKISFPFALPSMRTGTLVEKCGYWMGLSIGEAGFMEKSRVLLGLQEERGKYCRSGPARMERSRREGRQGRERKGGVALKMNRK